MEYKDGAKGVRTTKINEASKILKKEKATQIHASGEKSPSEGTKVFLGESF